MMSATRCNSNTRLGCPIFFADHQFELHPDGALFWPEQQALILADLHLEKGSFLARFGSALPLLDTRDTLQRLAALIDHYQPEEILCLGDSFHDTQAPTRLAGEDLAQLNRLMGKVSHWHWVLGNHDPILPQALGGQRHISLLRSGMCLSHEPEEGEVAPQIIGHFHPKATLRVGGQRISGRCLIHDDQRMVLPAFGSFTGGLDVNHAALREQMMATPKAYLLYRRQVWRVPVDKNTTST